MITKYKPKNKPMPETKEYQPDLISRRVFAEKKFYDGKKNAERIESSNAPAAINRKKLRVMVLGGLEEVGRNMTLIEYDKEIIIIDMGLQFPEEDMPGIDYIIPNISYLEGKEDWIKGVIITHGHMIILAVFLI